MALDQPPSAAPSSSAPAADAPVADDEISGADSVAGVEDYWRNRVSAKDRGHVAAERALREEIETLNRRLAGTPASGSSGQPGDDQAMVELRRQLEQEQTLRLAAERRAKYPALAERVDDPRLFAALDEPSLAKLNAELDMGVGSRIAPTSPKRASAPVAKPLAEMSKAELEAQLRLSIDAGALAKDRR